MHDTTPAAPHPSASPDPPAAPDLTGRTLGDYRVLRCLGQGGMGQVYLAEQASLKRKVALKILRPETASNPVALARFEQEATAVARLSHANIVQVYAFGAIDGLHYMALEYVEGRNLRDYLARKGPPDVLLALSIMRQVAAALQRACEAGIIHRDIKPENILLNRKGEVKVADFGLSRCLDGEGQPVSLTQSGVTMGTPLYMSPEQVEGRPLDCRTDIYSLGVTCYHMLAGQPPFHGETAFEVAIKHVRDEPPPLRAARPDLPESLCAVVHKMLAKDPAQRHQTPRDLLRDLQRVREGLSGGLTTGPVNVSVELVPAPSGPVLPSATEPARRGRWLAALVVLSLLLAAAGGAAFAWYNRPAETSPPPPPGPVGKDGPGEGSDVDAVFRDREKEKELQAAVKKNLATGTGAGGLGTALELALFYLDRDRFDDAEQLFTLLEAQKGRPGYWALGRTGRGIVQSLRARDRTEAKAANSMFHDVADLRGLRGRHRWWAPPKRVTPDAVLWANPRFVYYAAKAVDLNRANGVDDRELPEFFKDLRGRPR